MNDFTEGKISKKLLLFSLPMLIGNLFQQLYSVVDMLVVGRFVSGNALAAVGVSLNVVMLVVSFLMGLTTGASVLISQFFGAKEHGKLKDTVSVSIVVHAAIAIVLTIVGVTLAPLILRLLDTDSVIFDDALVYLRVIMAGVVFTVFYNMYSAYMRALGDSRRPLYFLIFATLLNVVLDLFFVIALDMGVLGVAVATIIAQMAAVVISIIYATRRVPLLRVNKLFYDNKTMRLIFKYGLPAALQMSFVSLAQLAITRLINSFGASAMAGISAAARIDNFAIMPTSNLSAALSTFVAQNMGAGLENRAKKGFRSAIIYMLACSIFMSVILMIFSHPLVALFLDKGDVSTPEILRIGGEYLNIMVVFYFLFAILFAFSGFFRGVGDALVAMFISICSLAIRTLSAYGLVYLAGMGPQALAWSIPIGWGLSSIFGYVYYKKRRWVGKVAVKAKQLTIDN